MNTTTVPTLHAPSALQRFVHAVLRALRGTAAAWQCSRRRRAMQRELESLDDHMLRDIGVHRSEVSSLVSELIGAAPATRRAAMRQWGAH
jgi:uncharacterized protein YjiS (DUF1127 family)